MSDTAPPSVDFSLIAGHPALDLCNTVDWRLDPASRYERLTSYDAVLAWSRAVGLLSADEASAIGSLPELADPADGTAERELGLLLEVREAAYGVVVMGDEAAASRLSGMVADAVRACRLTRSGEASWDWNQPGITPATPRHRVLLALVDLVRSPAMRHARQCADGSCGWVYLDTSPRKSRLWCVAGDCGNRNRVRRHYQRTRGAAAGSTPGQSRIQASRNPGSRPGSM